MEKNKKIMIMEATESAYFQGASKILLSAQSNIKDHLSFLNNKGYLDRTNMSKFNRLQSLNNYVLTSAIDSYSDLNKEAESLITDAYIDAYNYSLFEVEYYTGYKTKPYKPDKNNFKDLINPLDPYTREERMDMIRRGVLGALALDITRGIFQEKPLKELNQTVDYHYDSYFKKVSRLFSTEVHWATEKSDFDNIIDLKDKLGVKVEKVWRSIIDAVTRDPHRGANGQKVLYDNPFTVGGEFLMYPGDSSASAWNRINCRCTMNTVFNGIEAGELFDKEYANWLER